jgi:hypothetical protein
MRKPQEDKHAEGDHQGTEDERGSGHDERKEGRPGVRRPSREKVYQRMPELLRGGRGVREILKFGARRPRRHMRDGLGPATQRQQIWYTMHIGLREGGSVGAVQSTCCETLRDYLR